ncbi:nitronate monooxygenase [Pseudarthrobacter sp. CC12]|uniref:NAD(P)H-dependent flavin oxidoreductase n=1 Tax=Pseudarthrobacter sp. CC12 TaxID=3029193 RepID=UPI003267D821
MSNKNPSTPDTTKDASSDEPKTELRATGVLASLGATVPLIAAPMAGGPSTPALVAAAASTGAFGFLAAGYKIVDALSQQISEVRAGTELFGVNLFAPNPVPVQRQAFTDYTKALAEAASRYGLDLSAVEPTEDDDDFDDKVELLVADPVPVVSFTFGLPTAETVQRLQKAGTQVFQTVTNPDEAEQAHALGVNGLIVQSYQAGGHSGTLTPHTPVKEIPLTELLAGVRAKVRLPLWAAGGISTHDGVREVLTAGAEAAVVGTVLLRSLESGASETYKNALADPIRTETILTTAFSGRPARALRNEFVSQFHTLAPAGYPALHHLTSPMRKAAAAAGDAEGINIWAGTGYRDATTEPAATILNRLIGRNRTP